MKRHLKDFNQFLNEADYDFEVLQSQIDKPIQPITTVIDDCGIDHHCETNPKSKTWDILIQEDSIPARDFMKILEAVKKAGGKNVTVTAAYKAVAQGDPHYRNQAWVQKYAFIIETGIRRSANYEDPTGSAYLTPAESAEIRRKAEEMPPWAKNPDGSGSVTRRVGEINPDGSRTWIDPDGKKWFWDKEGNLITKAGVPYKRK